MRLKGKVGRLRKAWNLNLLLLFKGKTTRGHQNGVQDRPLALEFIDSVKEEKKELINKPHRKDEREGIQPKNERGLTQD